MAKRRTKILSFPAFVRTRLPKELKMDWHDFYVMGGPAHEICVVDMKDPFSLIGLIGSFLSPFSGNRSTGRRVADLGDEYSGYAVTVNDSNYTKLFDRLVAEYKMYSGRSIEVTEEVVRLPK